MGKFYCFFNQCPNLNLHQIFLNFDLLDPDMVKNEPDLQL